MKSKKTICLILCTIMAAACFACGNNKFTPDWATPDGAPSSDYEPDDYTTGRTSTNNMLNFVSSNAELDAFINEYFARHLGNDTALAVGSGEIGRQTRSGWREWDSLFGGFWDASAANGTVTGKGGANAVNDNVNKWLLNKEDGNNNYLVQDNTGYVWTDTGIWQNNTFDDWGMGWAFPEVSGNGGKYWTFDSTSTSPSPGNVGTGAGVAGTSGDWIVEGDGTTVTKTVNSGTPGTLDIATRSGISKISLYTENFNVPTYLTPFLRMGIRFTGRGNFNIDDLYVSFKTTESGNEWLGEVPFSTFCVNGKTIGSENIEKGNYFFPMFLNEDWGISFGSDRNERKITALKIELVSKPGYTIQGTLSFDYICSEFDDRQIINCCNYIIAAKNNLEFSYDKELLKKVLPNARKAMNFLLDTCLGSTGLISVENIAGHFNDATRAYGTAIGNGYWDVDAFPNVNLYNNLEYYTALCDMIYLEEMARSLDLEEYEQDVITMGGKMDTEIVYTIETAESLPALAEKCRSRIQTEFWNEQTGRFHVGRRDDESGSIQDHGYTLFNEQAIMLGLATDEQAKSILDWINGERIVEGDNSQGEDIYHYEIAPRFNTHDISDVRELNGGEYTRGVGDFAYVYWCGWNGNVQNGGTGLHLSYYDVVAQSIVNTATGYGKLVDLQHWYEKVKAAGGVGTDFYRKYYRELEASDGYVPETSIHLNGTTIYPHLLQGGKDEAGNDQNGMIGVDCEFFEASVLIRSIPDAFFGLGTKADETLCFKPNLPDGLDFWRMENCIYSGYYYDVSIGKYFAEISNLRNYSTSVKGSQTAKLGVTFDIPAWDFEVCVGGVPTRAYTINGDGTLTVYTQLNDVRVEIRAK